MIERYLRQSTIWKRTTGRDRTGQPTYAPDQLLPCRWEWKRRLVRNQQGQEVVSEARVFTTGTVKVGDGLVDPDGRVWSVLAVSMQYGMSGRELYREVSL